MTLRKQLRALEDEKAGLIRDQQELIHYVKAKVAPLQETFGVTR